MRYSLYFKSAITILSILILCSCGIDNTMYNARKYFKSAQSRPLNQNGKPSSMAIDEYTKTIKKCGYILTERKNSKEADDALFLLAQSLFYKGGSQFQAKDQFESLITNFPKSPYVPEATFYIAQIYRQINDKRQAEFILEEYLRNPAMLKWHPKALSLLTDFAIEDNDFIKAQFWLEKILNQFPKSVEYKEASFLLGKNYYEQEDYVNSLAQFQKVVKVKSIKQVIKLDSWYYIALNQLMLQRYQQSYTTIEKLLKIDDRPDKLPQINLLKSRVLLALNNPEKAELLFDTIIKSNPRTAVSCEAYYWLAEYSYYKRGDVEKAIDYYNKAKIELSTSSFATESSDKQASLTQIYKTSNINKFENTQSYIDNKMSIAEDLYNIMNLPDSAFAVIDSIRLIPMEYQPKIDSLKIRIDKLQGQLDSLIVAKKAVQVQQDSIPAVSDSLHSNTIMADSLQLVKHDATETYHTQPDSIKVTTKQIAIPSVDSTAVKDSVITVADKIINKTINDSVSVNIKPVPDIGDSTSIAKDSSLVSINKPPQPVEEDAEIRQLRLQIDNIDKPYQKLLDRQDIFDKEYIPYSIFFKASLISKGHKDTLLLQSLYDDMVARYPQNKYTIALKLMIEGKPVYLIDKDIEREETRFDNALGAIDSAPDSALVELKNLTRSPISDISLKSNFRLGWFYTFEQPDTVIAKPYFDEVIKKDRSSDYALMLLRFYNGKKFIFPKAVSDSLRQVSINDSLKFSNKADSLLAPAAQDSISTDKSPDDKPIDKPALEVAKPALSPDTPLPEPINKPEEPEFKKPD